MKKLKWFGVFLLGLVCGFVAGVVFKYHKFPLVVAGEQMGSIAEWLGAIGTIGAVIIALQVRYDPERKAIAEKIQDEKECVNKLSSKAQDISNSFIMINFSLINIYRYCSSNCFDKNRLKVEKELQNIRSKVKSLLATNLLSDKLSTDAETLLDEISKIKAATITEENINDINKKISCFCDKLLKYSSEKNDEVRTKCEAILKCIKMYHISPIYFEASHIKKR